MESLYPLIPGKLWLPNVAEVGVFPVIPGRFPSDGKDAIGGEVEVLTIYEDVIEFCLGLEDLLSGTGHIRVQFPEVVYIGHVHVELRGAVSVQVRSQYLVGEETGCHHYGRSPWELYMSVCDIGRTLPTSMAHLTYGRGREEQDSLLEERQLPQHEHSGPVELHQVRDTPHRGLEALNINTHTN